MPTNPLFQLILCALGVFILWILCGPVLRHFSKPKPLPSLEDIMRADIDHAEREAYKHRREVETHQAMAGLYERRRDDLIEDLATRCGPEIRARSSDRIHIVTVGGGGSGGGSLAGNYE